MDITPDSLASTLTIAVTVYDRRDFILQAVQSALDQTIPVKVIVVEDCGPDAGMKPFVLEKFGDRIQYFRNSRRRGLFDNWNACLEFCKTPFLSILHDDDFLHPGFVAAMQELMSGAPHCGLYFGNSNIIDENGHFLGSTCGTTTASWRRIELSEFEEGNPVMFPGQAIRVEAARALGGFRSTSLYCGDYEMWAKLTADFGAAKTQRIVSSVRNHRDWNRGTSRVERSGKILGLNLVQQKRVSAMLRARGLPSHFNREKVLNNSQFSLKFLILNAASFSPRLLRYNHQILLASGAASWRHALFRGSARIFGPEFLDWTSRGYRFFFQARK